MSVERFTCEGATHRSMKWSLPHIYLHVLAVLCLEGLYHVIPGLLLPGNLNLLLIGQGVSPEKAKCFEMLRRVFSLFF